MNEQQLKKAVAQAMCAAAKRMRDAIPNCTPELEAQGVAMFLSGVSQTTWFLCANEGAVTPQLLDKIVTEVGQESGMFMRGKP